MGQLLTNVCTRLFGVLENVQCSELLMRLAKTGQEAAQHLNKTQGQDFSSIIDYEYAGDAIELKIHELLDSAFIMRFDKADIAHLAWELDEIIDGMKKAVEHVGVFAPHLEKLPAPARDLLDCTERMTGQVVELIEMLTRSRCDLGAVRKIVHELGKFEERADELRRLGKGIAAREFNYNGANPVAFHAWVRLYSLLEEITDSANHCGARVLSMVRKEA